MIKNINISIPIGIIDVLWDYDDIILLTSVFMNFTLLKQIINLNL